MTEAMAAGTLTVLQSFAKRQVDEGAQVAVYYIDRPDSPSIANIRERFDSKVSLRSFGSGRGKVAAYYELATAIHKAQNTAQFDVIHLHSSKAGAFGRLAHLFSRKSAKVFYSPHGFSFLREDVPPVVREALRCAEKMLARLGNGLVLTCASEQRVAEHSLGARNTYVVNSGVDERSVKGPGVSGDSPQTMPNVRPKVGVVARVTYQKAPWRFKLVADTLGEFADFIWIGSGDADKEALWLGEHTPTGWLSPQDLDAAFRELDIFLFPTLWEGMPLALMQAQATGVPSVVSDVVGNRDAVIHEKTGYVCSSDDELIARTRELIEDNELRRRMSEAAITWAHEKLTDRDLGVQSMAIYNGTAAAG